MQVMARLLVPPMQVRGETTVQNGSRMTSYYPPERSDASKLPLAPILSAFFFQEQMKTMSAASLIPYVNKLFQVWRTGKYSKLIVAQALVLAATGLYLYKTLVPPAKLRQYPSVNYFKLAYYFVTKKDPSQRASELIIPLLRKNNAKAYVVKYILPYTTL